MIAFSLRSSDYCINLDKNRLARRKYGYAPTKPAERLSKIVDGFCHFKKHSLSLIAAIDFIKTFPRSKNSPDL
jgi:hypothetical protein